MLPDRLTFDDECGPPRLEPQVPITVLPETSEPSDNLCRPQLTANPISPPSTDTSSTKLNEHPLLAHRPILAAMLMSAAARLPPSSPKFSVQSPTVSTTTAAYMNTNGKRERSVSVDSSDVMLKMPKLVSMVEECAPVVEEEQKPQLESTMPLVESTVENAAPPTLDSLTTAEIVEEPEVEVAPVEKVVEEEHLMEDNVEEEKPKTTENHDTTIASSSGVSSANSSLLVEEPIIIRFKRPVEAKIEPAESEK
jgi:hypothetical protein